MTPAYDPGQPAEPAVMVVKGPSVQEQSSMQRQGARVDQTSPDLARSLHELHQLVGDLRFPLSLPDTDEMRGEQHRVLRLLESYALPRLSSPQSAISNAPLVLVVGGATGAGKSTITNSLVGHETSPSGIMRPTTRQPVLVYHPDDGPALHALGLFRSATQSGGPDASRWVQLRAVPSEDLPPGLAIIDSPDLDSRVEGNRELAARLLDVADMWLFVTTGTDYADAMSWDLLAQAADRKVGISVVLNRLRPRETATVRDHFASLLTNAGLAHAHVFTMPETNLIDGRIPITAIRPLQRWLHRRAQDDYGRRQMVDQALDGTLQQAVDGTRTLARGMAVQLGSIRRLHNDLESAFSNARETLRRRAGDASLVREDLIESWRAVNSRATRGPDGRWIAPPAHAPANPVSGSLFRRRSRNVQPSAADAYLAVGRSLNAALTEVLRAQLAQTLWQVGERWEPLRANANGNLALTSDVPDDFNDRAASATLSWLTSLQRRLQSAGASPTVALHPTVDPLTLALASLAAEGRPGRAEELEPDAANRAARLREQLEIPLADLLEHERLPLLLRDAWLDLLSVMHAVVGQEEARLAKLLSQLQLRNDLPALLQAQADAVLNARAAWAWTVSAEALQASPPG